jgi:hypothetical protein
MSCSVPTGGVSRLDEVDSLISKGVRQGVHTALRRLARTMVVSTLMSLDEDVHREDPRATSSP